MPDWEGLEDASAKAQVVWLSRPMRSDSKARRSSCDSAASSPLPANDGGWSPLRKVDCRSLNDRQAGSQHVLVEAGRATADTVEMVVRYNFYNSPSRELCRATWFLRPYNKKTPHNLLVPLPMDDCDAVEYLYQKALRAFSPVTGGKTLRDAVLKEEVPLSMGGGSVDGEGESGTSYVAIVSHNYGTGSISIRRRPASRLTAMLSFSDGNILLQRGYGEYEVEGEEEETSLGPVRHLVFVIHGIGEAMWSRSDVNVNSMVEEMNCMRAAMHRRQVEIWKKECERSEKEWRSGRENRKKDIGSHVDNDIMPPMPPPNRIELLPIQWFDRIHSSTGCLKKSLNAVTLSTIPALRDIANDVVFDVLMYMTPEFCQQTLACVTTQIKELYQKFRSVHDDFASSGGKCSIIGHSLGSVITWDLLSILNGTKRAEKRERQRSEQKRQRKKEFNVWSDAFSGAFTLSSSPANIISSDNEDEEGNKGSNTWGPNLKRELETTIPFEPDFTIFLGSPLGLFLTLRGAHEVFDNMRLLKAETAVANSSRTAMEFACGPQGDDEDEAARKEAELWRTTTSPFRLPTASLYNIFHPSDPVAYRIEPLLLSPDLPRNDVPEPCVLASAEGSVGTHAVLKHLGDSIQRLTALAGVGSEERSCPKWKFALGGQSDRVDFKLRQGIVENQYLAAVTAHQGYFTNGDVLDFIIETAARSGNSWIMESHL